MPRSQCAFFPSLTPNAEVDDEDESERGVVNGDESIIEEEAYDHVMDVDSYGDNDGSGSDLYGHLSNVSDDVLVFVATACLERLSDAAVNRLLIRESESFRKEVLVLWKNGISTFHKHHICNGCGKEMTSNDLCCGEVIVYHRVGAFNQLVDVTKQYVPEILKIREQLRNGSEDHHNLKGTFLRTLWEEETGNKLELSVIGSIDGVCLTGNTKSKIWPVTFLLVDLPTAEMQRAKNLVMHGIAQGPVNPSTHFWNKVIPMIYDDIEKREFIEGKDVGYNIVSWVADQPAKRSLFGMRGCNSENSCFYGMCGGTHHKSMAQDRSTVRPDEKTDEDAAMGQHGFGPVPPIIVQYVQPYDTVLDILHNASQGVYSIVIAETLNTSDRRSDLFENDFAEHLKICESVILPTEFDIKKMTNCSETLTYFRTAFGLSALVNPSLKPDARLVILALMLLTNGLYTNAPAPNLMFVHLTAAARWGLERASKRYMATKAHEILAHLPSVLKKFGNVASLSTFCYEHFYKYSLKQFNPQKTKGFVEAAISRVLLHSGIRREIQLRSSKTISPLLQNFLKLTPELKQFEPAWKHPISLLLPEDQQGTSQSSHHFSTLILSIGRLQSNYRNVNTRNDIFFAINSAGVHCCYRFICVSVRGDEQLVLAERIVPVSPDSLFPSLQKVADDMERPLNTYAFNVLTCFKRYSGILHGKLSGQREIIAFESIKGMGGYLQTDSTAYYLQLNGACVHH